ncbi:TIGR03084 family metal-binding protein [Micromonospora sediminicola]|uniref:TIGR03084 family metal-binding protein n=1 Tax=Micromonospora sediminicola TaxID=946078 RepID=UPI0033C41E50
MPAVVADLVAEGDDLDDIVKGLTPEQWSLPTPAPEWTITHQVGHLAATFRLAAMAASRPEQFTTFISTLSPNFKANVDAAMADFITERPAALLTRWRAERRNAEQALAALPPQQMVPWLVRPIPAAVLAAAGMMESFAHGQDILDALGLQRRHTDRLRHLVAFAVMTWDFGYQARDLTPPQVEFRFEIKAPSGEIWAFGPQDTDQVIAGDAVDFCLLVTRRRHRDDLKVHATGELADEWLNIAQAYRGPAGDGRRPGQFMPSTA